MKISSRKDKGNLVVNLFVDGDVWTSAIKEEWNNFFKNLELKGFRKGKVPEDVAKKQISDIKLQENAIHVIIKKFEKEINEEFSKERIITNPNLMIKKISNMELEIAFSSILFPEITIGDLSKVKSKLVLSKTPSTNSLKSEMDNFKKNLIKRLEYTDSSHSLKKDQIAKINYEGKLNGSKFENGSAEDYELKIGSKSFIDNFEDQLIGMKPGEEKDIKAKFPKEYPEKKLAGQVADFHVKLISIVEEKLLEGEELKKKLKGMKFNDFSDVEKKISSFILERQNEEEREKFFDDVVNEIIKFNDTKVDIPQEFIDQELEQSLKAFENKLISQGMKINDYIKMINKNLEDFKKENLLPETMKRINNKLIYSQLIKDKKIKISKEEIEEEYKIISKKQGFGVEEIKKYLKAENIEDMIFFKKIIEVFSK